MKSDSKVLQIINVIGFIAVVAINILANALPINGKNTGELADLYPNLFVPAGYVFSIWFVIYLLLLAFSIYQASPKRRGAGFIERIGYFFGFSCAANIIWIFLWHYEMVLPSLIAMIAILGSLIMIYIRLDIGRNQSPREERLYVQLPFSVYLGWITVATIANVVALLISMIAVAVFLTLINIQTRTDIGYTMVVIWALGGIIVKQMMIKNIVYISGLGIILLFSFLFYKKFRTRKPTYQ
jgi:hypothetical protein